MCSIPRSLQCTSAPGAVNILAYANDLGIILRDTSEYQPLHQLIDLHCQASNAKLNLQKTEMISLCRTPLPQRKDFFASLNIHKWYDSHSPNAAIYLGYPFICHKRQLHAYYDTLMGKIEAAIGALTPRRLSMRGKALITNSLLLSKLWYVSRISPPDAHWMRKLQSSLRKFVVPFFPTPSWDKLTHPKKSLQGNEAGAGVVRVERKRRKSFTNALEMEASLTNGHSNMGAKETGSRTEATEQATMRLSCRASSLETMLCMTGLSKYLNWERSTMSRGHSLSSRG
jgi:hypothetical protein